MKDQTEATRMARHQVTATTLAQNVDAHIAEHAGHGDGKTAL